MYNFKYFVVVVLVTVLFGLAGAASFRNNKYYRLELCQSGENCKYVFGLVGPEKLGDDGESGSGRIQVADVKFHESFEDSFRTAHQLDQLLDNPQSLIVRGIFTKKLKSYTFTVVDLYKEIPLPSGNSASPANGNLYFVRSNVLLCKFGNCGAVDAVNVNDADDVVAIKDLSDPYVKVDGFDGEWYRDALTDQRIMIQIEPDSHIQVTRSYAQIVTGHSCPVTQNLKCNKLQTPVFSRDQYLCTKPDGCVDKPSSCQESTIQCAADYKQVTIPMKPTGCPVTYCDPSFLH